MKKIILSIFALVLFSLQSLNAKPYSINDESTIEDSTIETASVDEVAKKEFVRIDKKSTKAKFAYQGELLLGATFSFMNLSSENSDLYLLLSGIDAEASYSSVQPFVGYFYRDNRCVGFRFGNNSLTASLDEAEFSLGESSDIALDIPYFRTSSRGYTYGIFHRSYIAIDKKGTFGLFAEVELMHSYTKANISYESGESISTTRSENKKLELGFNPGAAVYIMPNVCATLSFGFGGIYYTDIKQFDSEGVLIGNRNASKLSLNFNVTAINLGVSVHLW